LYKGSFNEGTDTGIGKVIYPDGAYYVGEVVKGQKEGIGRLTRDDWIYEGWWVKD